MRIGDPGDEAPGAALHRARRETEAVTPGRWTLAFFDLPEHTLKQGFWGGVRTSDQIGTRAARQAGNDTSKLGNVRYWPGARLWTLTPMQTKQSWYQERLPEGVTPSDTTITPGPINLPIPLVSNPSKLIPIPIWTPPSGVGILSHPGVAAAPVDVMSVKQVPADSSWNGAILQARSAPTGSQAQVTGASQATALRVSSYPLTTQYAPDTIYRADQGFYLRWFVNGTPLHHPDYAMNFYFGQFCLTLGGDGLANLTEWCKPKNGGANSERWVQRFAFRYCRPAQVIAVTHTLFIFPVLGQRGERYICFSGGQTDGQTGTPMDVTYEITKESRNGDQQPVPAGNITLPAPIRLDVRQDLRIFWQVQRLMFPAVGSLTDEAWSMPDAAGSNLALSPRMLFRSPANPAQEAKITSHVKSSLGEDIYVNKYSGSTLQDTQSPHKGKIEVNFVFNGGLEAGSATDALAGYYLDTPILYGYGLSRESVSNVTERLPLTSELLNISFSVMGADTRQDTGQITIDDATGAMVRLGNRGETNCKITTSIAGVNPSSGDDATQSLATLFHGDAARIRRTRHLHVPAKRGVIGPDVAYPSEQWSEYVCTLAGMYRRVAEINSSIITLENFGQDTDAPFDPIVQAQPPWKVTEIIKYLLRQSGFPQEQIQIADNPLRLWSSGQGKSIEDQHYTPNTRILEQCIRLAKIHLGANLVYDLGAGPLAGSDRPDKGSPQGAWRLVFSPQEGDAPLLDFVTEQPAGKAGVGARVWGANRTFISGKPSSYYLPPEFNHVRIMTGFETSGKGGFAISRDLYNYKSYDVPGSTIPADVESPHYLGREKLYIHVDPTLFVEAGDDRNEATQNAVDLVAWRLLNTGGRAFEIYPFRAPLMIVTDPTNGRKRVPMWGDPVAVDGDPDWFIRSCSPSYDNDFMQMADYELVKLVKLN